MLITSGRFLRFEKWVSVIQLKCLFLQRNEMGIKHYMFGFHGLEFRS